MLSHAYQKNLVYIGKGSPNPKVYGDLTNLGDWAQSYSQW